jgi:ComF family protein
LDPPPFESARALVVYQKEIFPVIHQMKYGPRPSLARFLGDLLARLLGGELDRIGIEEVLPVPLHPRRVRERGFNQAALMAGPVANRLRVRVNHGIVKRVRWTSPQVGLTKPQREMNLRGAFRVGDRRGVAEKRWLLVDDVYTTGSTLREVSRVLKRAGASEVHVLTFARVE